MAQLVKNPPAMRETWFRSLGWEDPLEKGKAPHSSILAWRIPWTFYSPWGHKELDMTERLSLSLHVGPFMCNVTIDMLACAQHLSICFVLAYLFAFFFLLDYF